ncbi:MAG TPA: GTPase Era [Candidatus Kapabacteria bacterium]|nr:GTPase Era [Candidatus Kapabacteria bacterium]
MSTPFKSGYCAIVGIPNAGKSTLLNTLLETKLSITSAKPQTTRKRVLGIYSSTSEQIIFLDTPGIMPRPTTLHHKALLEEVRHSFDDADVIIVLAEANKPLDRALPDQWRKYVDLAKGKPMILALSKIDLIKDKKGLLPILQKFGEMHLFAEIFPFSSKSKHNIKHLPALIAKYLPEGKPFFDEEQLSDQNDRFFVSEFIRETVFKQFRDEIPYSTEVDITEYNEREEGKWHISAEIIVERDSQKSIIIGKAGESLKKLGASARFEIEKFIGHPVYLELHVKTRKDWREDKNLLKNFGYYV